MLKNKRVLAVLVATWAGISFSSAEEKKTEANKPEPKDPLSKFSDEDLADPGVACQKFFEAIGGEDAAVVKAFLAEAPKHIEKLDPKKKEDAAAIIKAFSNYKGANVTKSQRIAAAGVAEITYEKDGAEKTLPMQNIGGRWKYVGD